MATTPEGKVKKRVTDILTLLGAYYFFPMTGGYGTSGVPDIVGCWQGLFFGIECKAEGNQPTALQQMQLSRIGQHNGTAFVVNEATATYEYIYEQLNKGRSRLQERLRVEDQ